MAFWILKSEPTDYPFAKLQKEKKAAWTGIRNYTARNNLRAMKKGDLALFFHTGKDKAVVGIAKLLAEAYPDPTAKGEDFSAIDIGPVKSLVEPVPLATLKAQAATKEMSIVRQGRLSAGAATAAEWKAVLELGATKL